jgi:hypothetical protein
MHTSNSPEKSSRWVISFICLDPAFLSIAAQGRRGAGWPCDHVFVLCVSAWICAYLSITHDSVFMWQALMPEALVATAPATPSQQGALLARRVLRSLLTAHSYDNLRELVKAIEALALRRHGHGKGSSQMVIVKDRV